MSDYSRSPSHSSGSSGFLQCRSRESSPTPSWVMSGYGSPASSARSWHSSNMASPANADYLEPAPEPVLPREEDPGPGTVKVRVAGSPVVHTVNKRRLAAQSEYFKASLSRFHNDKVAGAVELEPGFVSSQAWTIIHHFVETSQLGIDNHNAFELLQASNYLQMDAVQSKAVEQMKKKIDKRNFLQIYDFAVRRGISSLSNYITATIIKPAEMVRRRKFGRADLQLGLGQLVFPAHTVVLAAASRSLATSLARPDIGAKPDCSQLGLPSANPQLCYNLLELIYLGKQEVESVAGTSVKGLLAMFRAITSLELSASLAQSCLALLARTADVEIAGLLWRTGEEVDSEDLQKLATVLLLAKPRKQLLAALPAHQAAAVLDDSHLAVDTEMEVAELALGWLEENAEAEQSSENVELLLSTVRWDHLVPAERDLLLARQLFRGRPDLARVATSQAGRMRRGWPELLVQVPLDQEKCHRIQFYNPQVQQWSLLTSLPDHCPDVAVVALGGSIVLVRALALHYIHTRGGEPSRKSAKKIEICLAYARYCLKNDKWSFSPNWGEDCGVVGPQPPPPVVAVVAERLYCLLHRAGDRLELHSLARLDTDCPERSVVETPELRDCWAGPVHLAAVGDKLHILAGIHYLTFHPASRRWSQPSLLAAPPPSQAAVAGWAGRVVRVGGRHSAECVEVTALPGGAGAEQLGRLPAPRTGHSLTVYRGLLCLAGGRSEDKDGGLLIYQPELQSWARLAVQPERARGAVTLLATPAPVRLLDWTAWSISRQTVNYSRK